MTVLAPGGGLARAIPHYEDRPEQRAMSDAVARALADDRPLLVEAGTGTGKTLAYLVPALASGKKVVVSTGTRALQDQIARHDVPLLRAIIGRPFAAVVLKGVANYACRRKLDEVASRAHDATIAAVLRWAGETATGDRAEIEWLAEDAPVWNDLTVTPETRIGPRCPYFDDCFATRARRAAESADLILVNHHLYFADLSLRATRPGARVLPDHDAVIFDEAHQLEDVATEHFAARISSARIGQLVRDARIALLPLFAGVDAERVVADVERAGDGLMRRAREALVKAGAADQRVPLPEGMFDSGELQAAWFSLDAALEALARSTEADDTPDADTITQVASLVARRARAMRDDLAAIADQRQPAHVYWGEVRAGAGTILTASPITVAGVMRRMIGSGPTAVLTSATLTVATDFGYTRERLGLDGELADELVVASPFDYASQALLYVPRDLPEPVADELPAEAVRARIVDLVEITGGRAFVLFTSHRALRAVAAWLPSKIRYPVIVQGDGPRAALLDRFRATPNAVLLGTGSFWEGVDVPGDALSLVIIDKLPFAPHTDPLIAARMRVRGEAGGDPFADVQLPAAAISLRQGFGRLIRRRDDRGIVAILDPRIVTRRYGRVFVDSLPAGLHRTSAIEQVRRWWTASPSQAMVAT
jgi:ATP-dependent DNA helicase DinG